MSQPQPAIPQMIDWSPLLGPVPPWAHFVECSQRALGSLVVRFRLSAPEREAVKVLVTRGAKSRSQSALFCEWSAALQFPGYFGFNWDAFEECIHDMDWLPATSYVFVVSDSDLLLDDNDMLLQTFIAICQDSAELWVSYVEGGDRWPRNALFHLLFHAEPARASIARARLRAAGAELHDVPLLFDLSPDE